MRTLAVALAQSQVVAIVGVEQGPYKRGVAGSTPAAPTPRDLLKRLSAPGRTSGMVA